ncbi:PH domain-containing protein [Halobacillus litoralis]|uniref:PH domain-containing protein n=1 Tax=Halobacillus litoralis TaxID=45668 RepID=UPI0024924E61|nr:PH domain-containing protein [Halobacillus litoralis]
MYFPSKKDSWLAMILWGVVLVCLIDGIFNFQWGVYMLPSPLDDYFMKLAVLLIISGSLLWVWFRTGYKIGEQWLIVHFGPIKKKIPIEEIGKVFPSKDPFIAPALSVNRLEIHYGNGRYVKVSPKDKGLFLKQLREKLTRKESPYDHS